MAKYQLLADHYIGEALVPAGTIIDTSEPAFAKFKPSMHTAGADAAGEAEVKRRADRRRRDPVQALPANFAVDNGYVRAEDVPGNPAPATYSVSTPTPVMPSGGPAVPRIGEIEVSSEAAKEPAPHARHAEGATDKKVDPDALSVARPGSAKK